jgi:hypothetical protein
LIFGPAGKLAATEIALQVEVISGNGLRLLEKRNLDDLRYLVLQQLLVEPQQVVRGESEAADWRIAF